MSAFSTALNSPRFARRLMIISAVVLAIGLVAFLIVHFSFRSGPPPQVFSNQPNVDVSKLDTGKQVPLVPEEKRVAKLFVESAVARKHLALSYNIVGPDIKQGESLKDWLTGNIAVVPYPVAEVAFNAPFRVDFSFPTHALLEVALLSKNELKVRSQLFFLDLKKYGSHWLVDGWVPRASPVVPAANP